MGLVLRILISGKKFFKFPVENYLWLVLSVFWVYLIVISNLCPLTKETCDRDFCNRDFRERDFREIKNSRVEKVFNFREWRKSLELISHRTDDESSLEKLLLNKLFLIIKKYHVPILLICLQVCFLTNFTISQGADLELWVGSAKTLHFSNFNFFQTSIYSKW